MLSFIKNIFGSKKPAPQLAPVSDFREVTVAELDEYPDALKNMHDRVFDGFLVKNVLSPEEVQKLLKGMDNIPAEQWIKMPEGRTYPRVFAQVVRNMMGEAPIDATQEHFHRYFQECADFREQAASIFEFDVEARIKDILNKIAGGREVRVPLGMDGVGSYPSYTIRQLNPNVGNMSVHCGNYFQQEFPQFYEHLMKTSDILDQLSFFIVVSEPEEGGELTLYDLDWTPGQTKEHPQANEYVELPSGEFLEVDNPAKVRTVKIKPKAGDMIIFAGGQIWHRVEIVQGNKPRITFGGFMSFSRDYKALEHWS